MTEGQVLDVMRDAFYTMILCAAPMLLTSLVVGLAVSIFQTVTSIQEQTLTFVPKLLAIFLTLMVGGNWMLNNMITFMKELWSDFSIYIH